MDKSEKLITFWCTCEVLTARIQEDPPPALIPGVEFTERAVPEQGRPEIHWLHSSPARDVGPGMRGSCAWIWNSENFCELA